MVRSLLKLDNRAAGMQTETRFHADASDDAEPTGVASVRRGCCRSLLKVAPAPSWCDLEGEPPLCVEDLMAGWQSVVQHVEGEFDSFAQRVALREKQEALRAKQAAVRNKKVASGRWWVVGSR